MTRIQAILFLILICHLMTAQEKPRNTGLSEAQDPRTLPVSNTRPETPSRMARAERHARLEQVKDGELLITGGWEMIGADQLKLEGKQISQPMNTPDWYQATVPGTVLSTLVDQGVYPDPYFGLNNLQIPDTLCRTDWWYRTVFPAPAYKATDQVWLILNGINYEAQVWLNGQKLGRIKGAFIRGIFEVSELLEESNVLAVHILPPPHPGIPHEASARSPRGPNGGALCQDGPTFISSEGWDWVPGIRDRNIGIWQDVRLKLTGRARLVDPYVVTKLSLPDTSVAEISLKTEVECLSEGNYRLEVRLAGERSVTRLKLKAGSNRLQLSSKELNALRMKEPRLWWPNGYGEAHLYTLKLVLKDQQSNIMDEKSLRFGVRELSYEFAVAGGEKDFQRILFHPVDAFSMRKEGLFDHSRRVPYEGEIVLPTLRQGVDLAQFQKLEGDNPYLVIRVNGLPVFCKGGNWGMDDAMKRVSRERLEPYFKLHREAHYTMIRNWTGESTEEVFYELADEYGLLVWNDFWMSTEGYNMPPVDFDLFMANASDVVRRFRNHPSIAIWCSRNEGYAPEGLDKPLNDLVAREDGSRMYQSNSRYLNLRPSGPWHYINDLSYYFRTRAEGFSTEVGTQSFPTAESMRAMMAPEDVWPISDTWYYHDLHTGHEDYRADIIRKYAEAFTLEEFLKKAQLVNYDTHRGIFEAWNNKLWNDASGVLLWMTHPAWPSMIWQTYSSDYETYGAYFGAKKACEPVHIQMNEHNREVIAVNTSRKDFKQLQVSARIMNAEGRILHERHGLISLPANSRQSCFTFEAPETLVLPEVYFSKLLLTDPEGGQLSDNFYWDSPNRQYHFYRFNTLDQVTLDGEGDLKMEEDQLSGRIRIRNSSATLALSIKLNLRDQSDQERILPAYFSDGYFSLMPGEEKEVFVECPGKVLPSAYYISAEGYNVERQRLF